MRYDDADDMLDDVDEIHGLLDDLIADGLMTLLDGDDDAELSEAIDMMIKG